MVWDRRSGVPMKIPIGLFVSAWKRGFRGVIWSLGLCLLYAFVGFVILPRLLQTHLPKRLSELLGRTVTVAKVRTNPFTLAVTVEGFRIQDRDGCTLLGWQRLHVNWELRSLFTRTQYFRVIELVEPQGRLVLEKDGTSNIQDIVARFSNAPTTTSNTPSTAWNIHALRILRARLDLLDRTPTSPFATTLGPVSFEVRDFQTRRDRQSPYSLEGITEAGERFRWKGTFSLAPLASEGELALERIDLAKYAPYYRDRVKFELRKGRLSAQATYRFIWSEGHHVLKLSNGHADVSNLELGAPNASEQALALPQVGLKGLEVDVLAPRLAIDTLSLKAPQVHLQRQTDGTLDLLDLLTPKIEPRAQPSPSPLALSLNKLLVEDAALVFRDAVPPRPVTLEIPDLDLSLDAFSLDPQAPAHLTMSCSLRSGGRLEAHGPIWPLQPALDLDVTLLDVALPPFERYLEPDLALTVNRGRASAAGRLYARFDTPASQGLTYKGRLDLRDLEVMDTVGREPFLRYRRLLLEGLDLDLQARRSTIARVSLEAPEHRLVIAPDGTTNVGRALNLQSRPASVAAQALPPTPDRPLALTLKDIRVNQGRLSLIDRSVQPAAVLTISDLVGRYEGLSTEEDGVSNVNLNGLASGIAPFHLQGRTRPLRTDLDTDVTLTLKGADLTDLSPYAGKYLGYTIRKGKLDLDARVRIERRALDARIQARMDQCFLGDKVESPDATRLPVRLALAILRDRHGVITLDLPIEGSLDDPNYRYGRIVWQALLNLLTKIVTSPFTLLSKLGGAENLDLRYVTFEPGRSDLSPETVSKLQTLSKALLERPDLALELTSQPDPIADVQALRRLLLEDELQKLKDGAKPGASAPLKPDEREHWLQQLFLATFPPPTVKGAPPPVLPPPAEQEQRLLKALPLPPETLRDLSEARLRNLRAHLIDAGIRAERLFQVTSQASPAPGSAPQVLFAVK